MQIKRFPLEEGVVARLGILNSVAVYDLTKDQISIANIALHSPILCLKIIWRLFWKFKGCLCPINLCLISGIRLST